MFYNIPRVHVKQLVDEVWRICDLEEDDVGEDEFMNTVREKVDELRTAKFDEAIEAMGEAADDEEFDQDAFKDTLKYTIRIPDEQLYPLLKKKLNENAC